MVKNIFGSNNQYTLNNLSSGLNIESTPINKNNSIDILNLSKNNNNWQIGVTPTNYGFYIDKINGNKNIIYINENQNIGIGLINPTHKLHISGTLNVDNKLIITDKINLNTDIIIGKQTSLINEGNCILNNITVNTNLFISGNTLINNNLEVSGMTFIKNLIADKIEYKILQTTSDERLKSNIKKTNLGLNFINRLNPVTYQLNDIEHHGFIAQDVKKIVNEMNIIFNGCTDSILKDNISYLSLNLLEFIGPIVKSIQELSDKIDNITNKINNL
jgi:hypothetical protein